MATGHSRARFGAALATAFLCGLLFASGFDLTRFGWAQATTGSKVSSSEVQSLAETGNAFEAIADHVTPSVVSIATQRVRTARARGRNAPGSIEDFFRQFDPQGQAPGQGQGGQGQPREESQDASGSGFIVSKDGYILTNNHVVADADKVTVTLSDKRVFDATVVGRDPTTDVALIKVNATGLPVATLGDDATARVGQWVVAIGNPLGLDFTVTAGIISAKGRPLQGLLPNRYAITDYIQTDAAINPGNSGGPLVNIRGEVIGINSAIASTTGMYAGYGFAIPVTLAKQVMDDIIRYGRVRRAVIGVGILDATPADAKAAGLDKVTGVLVTTFSEDAKGYSAAREAGVKPGDVIVAADGRPTDRTGTLQRIVRSHAPGETVSFDVMRFGEKKSFRVKLGEAPDPTAQQVADGGATPAPARRNDSQRFDKVGVTVEPVSADLANRARLSDVAKRGLLVSEVSVTGPAYRKLGADQTILLSVITPGLQRELRTPGDLDSVLAKVRSGDVVTFLVYDIGVQDSPTRAISLQVQ